MSGTPSSRDPTTRGLLNVNDLEYRRDVDGLIRLLDDRTRDDMLTVRGAAAKALGRLRATAAAEPLVGLLSDEEPTVRASAVVALGKIGSESSIDAIAPLLRDPHPGIRRQAAIALGRIGAGRVSNQITGLLSDEHRGVRRAAADALERIGDARTLPALERAGSEAGFLERRRYRRAARAVKRRVDAAQRT